MCYPPREGFNSFIITTVQCTECLHKLVKQQILLYRWGEEERGGGERERERVGEGERREMRGRETGESDRGGREGKERDLDF